MKSYLIKRFILLIPLLLGVTILTFSLTKALPGDPVYSLVGERAKPEVVEKIRRELGSDANVIRQYLGYLKLLVQGELGRSYFTNRQVLDDIMMKFPNTLKLAAAAMIIAVPAGLLFGFIAARRKDTLLDRVISFCAVSGMSFPVFWSGLLLMIVFALNLRILPPSGTGGLRFLVLPALTLSLPAMGTLARITRTTVLEILDAPFVKTLEAKGIGEMKIQLVHVLRNALIPITTVIGLEVASYLNGAVLTETIFGWDGMGRFIMEGIIKRDYPVIMGCVIVGTLVFIGINLVVDILYHCFDPRVRIDDKNR
jgi:ABC-type dipeptide/oligopeptide/nickel transport system permease component